jgi:hypothetical protein
MKTSVILLAALFGTSVMLSVMSALRQLKWADADMVRAIGSLVTKSYEGSLLPGLLIDYVGGIFFAFLYSKLIGYSPIITPASTIIICAFTGLVHGITLGLVLEVFVAEYHPVAQFKKAGFAVVGAYVIGHIAFGLCLGLIYSRFVSELPVRPIPKFSVTW